MMRPHCDRCDALCDEYPSWIEDSRQALNAEPGVAAIWHIRIGENKTFCRACRIAILEMHVAALTSAKPLVYNKIIYGDVVVNERSPSYAEELAGHGKVKCDGNHAGPRCADPECWNDYQFGERGCS